MVFNAAATEFPHMLYDPIKILSFLITLTEFLNNLFLKRSFHNLLAFSYTIVAIQFFKRSCICVGLYLLYIIKTNYFVHCFFVKWISPLFVSNYLENNLFALHSQLKLQSKTLRKDT